MKFVAARQALGTFPVRGQSQDAGGDFILALTTSFKHNVPNRTCEHVQSGIMSISYAHNVLVLSQAISLIWVWVVPTRPVSQVWPANVTHLSNFLHTNLTGLSNTHDLYRLVRLVQCFTETTDFFF